MMRLIYSGILALCAASNSFGQDTSTSLERVRAGAQVFRRWCIECHGDGDHPGTSALQRKYQGAIPAVLEQRNSSQLPDALIRLAVRNGMSFMPFFRKTEVTDSDLDALVVYLTSDHASRVDANNQHPK